MKKEFYFTNCVNGQPDLFGGYYLGRLERDRVYWVKIKGRRKRSDYPAEAVRKRVNGVFWMEISKRRAELMLGRKLN